MTRTSYFSSTCWIFGKVVCRRDDDAASPHDRLGDEGGDRFGALALDQLVEFGGHAGGELVLGLALGAEAVEVRARREDHVLDRQVEVGVHRRQAGQGARGDGDAVIGLDAADDLLLFGLPAGVVVVPGELHLHVVGLRAAGAEQHLRGRAGGQLLELLRQLDDVVVRLAGEDVGERQFAHLLGGRVDQFLVGVAEG
jgi:hypothetical protein